MTAINYPIIYHRDFSRDYPPIIKGDCSENRYQKVASLVLPLLTLHRPFQAPISAVLSGTRTITEIRAALKSLEQKDINQAAFLFFHSCLATAAFGLLFFQPALSYVTTSSSDLIHHINEMKASLGLGEGYTACNAFFKALLDGLFLATILYGAIEITVACATLQIILELYNSGKNFRNGDFFEGFFQGILAAAHLKQATAQYRLIQWKYETTPRLEGTLVRNSQGFVYLEVPDDQIFSLLDYCGKRGIEAPPYFKPGMAGGHISVIAASEKTGAITELGQKFSFRISHVDSFDQLTKRVHLISVAAPSLEQVRLEQGLSSRLGGDHDFHITYGVEKL